MCKKCYTIQEIMTMKFYELPNIIYNAILEDLRKVFWIMTKRMIEILNKAPLYQIDQYCDIYKYIMVI